MLGPPCLTLDEFVVRIPVPRTQLSPVVQGDMLVLGPTTSVPLRLLHLPYVTGGDLVQEVLDV